MTDNLTSSDALNRREPGAGFDDAAVKSFWENKILGWERGRYVDQAGGETLLERWANRASRSLRFCIEVAELDAQGADLVFSLGLLDWLTYPEPDTLFDRTGGADFLHAISERRLSPSQWIHCLYCYVSYGYRTAGYLPRYHRGSEIEERCRVPVNVYRDPRLSFGALVTTLPLPDDV